MKKIVSDTFTEFRYPSMPGFSPDGKMLAFVESGVSKEENKYFGDIHVVNVASGEERRLTGSGDARSYVWTKTGKLLFPAMRDEKLKKRAEAGEPLTAFYEIDPAGGEAALAFTLPLSGASLRPIDGDRYLVSATYDNTLPDLSAMSEEEKEKTLRERRESPCDVLTEYPFWENGGGFTSGHRNRLYIFNRVSGELKPITGEWFDLAGFALSPDGKTVVFGGGEWRDYTSYTEKTGLFICDLKTLKTRELLGAGQFYLSGFDFLDADTLIMCAGDGAALETGDFYTLSIDSGECRKIADNDHGVGYGSVGSDARVGGGRGAKVVDGSWYFISTRGDGSELCVIRPDGRLADGLTPEGACDCFDIADGHLAFCGLYGNKLSELYLDGKAVTDYSSALSEYDVRTPEKHVFTASDGYEIHGWAMTPAGYKPGKKYPAILHIHGGPRTTFDGVFHHEMQVWANAGYFVFFCNPRGSDGRGDDFADIWGKYGSVDYANIMEFAELMLEKYPDADAERFGVTGGSYGGFMTNWIVGHTNRFAAACSQRSIANWTSFEHTTDIGIPFTETNHLTTTRENVSALWDFSPLKYAPNCVTPTLFIHSDSDYRCWMVEGLSMYTALKRNGCDAKLCLFKGENHDLSRTGRPKSRIRRMDEILSWFDKYLK